MTTTNRRARRRDHLSRTHATHAYRGRFRLRGDRFAWSIPSDLHPTVAARANKQVIAAIRLGADLRGLKVVERVGATDITIPVRVRRNGELVGPPPVAPTSTPDELTLAQALNRWHEQTCLAPLPGRHRRGPNGTVADARSNAARIRKVCATAVASGRLGDLPLSGVRADHFESIVIALRKAGRPASTVNKYSRLAKSFNAWTIRVGLRTTPIIAGDSPHFHKETETPRRQRLSTEDEAKLLAACNPHLRAVVTCALLAGMRLGEILALQWKHIDWRRRMIMIPAELAKSNRARGVPIAAPLLALLEMRSTLPDGKAMSPEHFVFGDELGRQVKAVKTAWRRSVTKVGLAHIRLHDLRRECASRLLEAGFGLHEVRDWLGHHDVGVTNRYVAANEEDLRRKLDKIEAKAAKPEEPAPAPSAPKLEPVAPTPISASLTVN